MSTPGRDTLHGGRLRRRVVATDRGSARTPARASDIENKKETQ